MTSFWSPSSLRSSPGLFAARICAGAILLGGLAACTVFDGLTASAKGEGGGGEGGGASVTGSSGPGSSGQGSGGASTSSGGAGGGGGALVPVNYVGDVRAVRACSRVFLCPNLAASIARSVGVPISDTNFSACMTWLNGPVSPDRKGFVDQQDILKCVADASSCAGAAACLPVEVIDAANAACSDSQPKCLDTSTSVDCAGLVIEHCGTAGFEAGSQCLSEDSDAACIKEGCGSSGDASCDGDTLVTCRAAGLVRSPCAVAGLACAAQGQGAICEGEGACSSAGASVCAGDVVHACTGKELSAFHCDAIGMSCATVKDGPAFCQPPGAECTPDSGTVNICTGNKSIAACVGGKVLDLGCPFGKCHDPANGKSAYCG